MTKPNPIAIIIGCSANPDDLVPVHSPEELAELMGWSVTACRELCGELGGDNVPCFIVRQPTEPVDEPERDSDELRDTIRRTAMDCAANFAYYDRKDDEDLSREDLDDAIDGGVVTLDEIAAWFREGLEGE